ncbi:MAG: aldo/keto reductase [Pedobacter sp.]|uniref:aldo/keto reductase n=1 Tax=Pedobacter sp. TaxID=1411316 RepID=UPI00356A4DE4
MNIESDLSQAGSIFPPVIFGTSCLGNIYEATDYTTKKSIVAACIENANGIAMFDTAGKYGAGLALESLGKSLRDLKVDPESVLISNKLGWYQTALTTPEPTFEKGIWKDLKNDAIQKISYAGILECFEQGNELLNGYSSQMVSVHDPDEYLAKAKNKQEEELLYQDILDAYKALIELKISGKVLGVGVGSKQWRVVERIAKDVDLDWVMIANSLTLHDHPKELLEFIEGLHKKNITVINSAVFNGGFLIGSDYYNYQPVDKTSLEGKRKYEWRDKFHKICKEFDVTPAEACVNFGLNIPGVTSIALSTSKSYKVKPNLQMVAKEIPLFFWETLLNEGLIKVKPDFNNASI